MNRINCIQCVHYYVTWQNTQPHGCKAYGFKSKELPSQVVKRTSGSACQLFETKKKTPGH